MVLREYARRVRWCVAAAVVVSSAPARAQGSGDTQTVTVRGAHDGSNVVREGDTPRESTDAASLVAQLPGVYVRRQGADDALATLSIRGTSPQQAAVYLAGVPITGGGDPAMDLSLLPVWPGMRVRVHRTFAPASLGRPALGGALSMDAPSLRVGSSGGWSSQRTEVYAAAGSYGAARFRVGELATVGKTTIAVVGFGSRADNDFTYLDPIASRRDAPVLRVRENAGHAATGAMLQLTTPVPQPFSRAPATLTVTAYGLLRRQEIAGSVRLPTPYQSTQSARTLSSVDLSIPTARGALHAQIYHRYDTLALRDQPASARLTASPVRLEDGFFTLGVRLGGTQRVALDRSSLLDVGLHLDGMREEYMPGERMQAARNSAASRSSVGAAGELQLSLWRRVRSALHARVDGWQDTSPALTRGVELLPSGHLDVEVELARGLSALSRVGRTARVASFLERFGNQGLFVGDPELRPESAWTQDVGVRARVGSADRLLDLELTGFRSEARDLILFVPQGAFGRAKAQNLGLAWFAGVEGLLAARVRVLPWLTPFMRVVYNYLLSENRAGCLASAVAEGRCEAPPLPGRPRHVLSGDVGFDLDRVSVRYGLDVTSGMFADAVGAIPVPSRVLQSVGVRVRLPYGIESGVDLRNLADVRTGTYMGAFGAPVLAPIGDQFDYPLPGRTMFVFARLSR